MKKLISILSLVTLLSPLSALALQFDGSNDYISIPTISVATNITVSLWVKSPTLGTFGSNMFFILKTPVNSNWNFFVEAGNTIWRSTGQQIAYAARPSSNVWHHLVATQAGTAANIYIDGVLVKTGTMNAIGNGATAIEIGRYAAAGYMFNGQINDVRIYNRVLMPGEIRMLYRGLASRNGLVGYWPLIGNAGGTFEPDFSGYRNHGTRTNGPVRAALSPFTRFRLGR